MEKIRIRDGKNSGDKPPGSTTLILSSSGALTVAQNRLHALCCRDNKAYQGGDRGWYIPLRSHSTAGGCRPLGCLAMTLATPGYGKPSLLSLNEVKELLRQFGKVNIATVFIK
jgi:hypothetical protein